MQTLLVVGVDTLAGSNLALACSDEFTVVGLSETGASVDSIPVVTCGLKDAADVFEQLRSVQPDWIVHCGPFARSSWEPQQPAATAAVDEAVHVARAAEQIGCYLTVLSTDAVCAGPWIFHDEGQIPCALGLAAQAALCMEEAVLRTCRRSLVARTSAYGWAGGERPCGLVETVLDCMEAQRPLRLDANRYATPILATDVAAALRDAYHKELTGLFHVAGSERTSPYGFGLALSDVFSLSPACLQPVYHPAGDLSKPQPHETSLATDRIRRAVGRSMPMLYEGLRRLRQQKDNGFADRLKSSAAKKPVAAKKSSLGNVA